MGKEMNYWLILEKSDGTRVSKGIDSYSDKTGKVYNYDSLVPNNKKIKINDYVVIRKENLIVGTGVIGSIVVSGSTKTHRRCPSCNTTDIRERSQKAPKWKCGKCGVEFDNPKETQTNVETYGIKGVGDK